MAKKAATEQKLGELHAIVADGLSRVIAEGQAATDSEGNVTVATAGAAYFAAAITFLKNNNITADPAENAALSDLAAALAAKRQAGKSKMASPSLEKAAEEYAVTSGVGVLQ